MSGPITRRPNGNVVLELTADEYALACAALAPSLDEDNEGGINHDGVYSTEWEKLRRKFPRRVFRERIAFHEQQQGDLYDPSEGNPLSYDKHAGT